MPNPNVPTPHIQALEGETAETILLPSDPLHAKYITDNFLEDMKQFNTTKNMSGYTGTYKGKRVSVMGTGVSCPSIGVYPHELVHFYGCKNLIRVRTAGTLSEKSKVRSMALTTGACTTSSHVCLPGLSEGYSCTANHELLSKVVEEAKAKGLTYHVGNILSSDMFYSPAKFVISGMTWSDMGVLAVEMETAALYSNVTAAGVNTLCTVTISDLVVTRETTAVEERQTTLTNMMGVALSLARRWLKNRRSALPALVFPSLAY